MRNRLRALVATGDARLDEPVVALLPAAAAPQAERMAAITLANLATHSSGLPRLPNNLRPASMADPYADYTAERLHEFVHTFAPARAARESFDQEVNSTPTAHKVFSVPLTRPELKTRINEIIHTTSMIKPAVCQIIGSFCD